MTEHDILELERATGLRLPEVYRRVLLNYPQSLLDMATVYPMKKGSPQRDGPENSTLYNDKQLLWRENVINREYKEGLYPPTYFVIGDSGCGDLYAIDTNDALAAVYISGPHIGEYPEDADGELQPISPTLGDWIDYLLADDTSDLAIEVPPDELHSAAVRERVSHRFPTDGPPCPKCQQPLRTVNSKQCFDCGADWH